MDYKPFAFSSLKLDYQKSSPLAIHDASPPLQDLWEVGLDGELVNNADAVPFLEVLKVPAKLDFPFLSHSFSFQHFIFGLFNFNYPFS